MTEYKCIICYDKKCNMTTSCSHQFCNDCLMKWTLKNPTCPYCRHPFDIQESQNIIFYTKRTTRSDTFSYRKKVVLKTFRTMLDNFLLIEQIDEQITQATKICNYVYSMIEFYKSNQQVIDTFVEKIHELEKDGVNECSIIRFKLREKNII